MSGPFDGFLNCVQRNKELVIMMSSKIMTSSKIMMSEFMIPSMIPFPTIIDEPVPVPFIPTWSLRDTCMYVCMYIHCLK